VLGTPRAEEREAIDAAIDRALAVMPQIMTGDLQGAMHLLHTSSATQAVTPNKTATP
jgi:PTH1 family peptidyl-tRNA hydrolase